jgi:hypothetical protein
MSEQASEKIFSGIDIPKVIAGTLAAVSAAVVGSFLGVAGTLAGAAVVSVIGSVGTEVYQRSLNKGVKHLQAFTPAFIKAPAAVGTPGVAAATEEDLPSHTVPEAERASRQIRWGRVAMIAGALFVLAMGSVTVAELITGKSVASTVGSSSGGGTTVGSLFEGGRHSTSTPAPATSSTPTDEATTSAPPEQREPSATPSTGVPTTAPTTGAPSVAPTTTVAPTNPPEQTTAPQGGNGNGGNGGGGVDNQQRGDEQVNGQ